MSSWWEHKLNKIWTNSTKDKTYTQNTANIFCDPEATVNYYSTLEALSNYFFKELNCNYYITEIKITTG